MFGNFVETENVAQPGDWIVTNPDGEQYILTNENFHSRYEKTSEAGVFKAIGTIKAIQNPFHKNIEIIAPWGSPQYGDTESWLAITLKDGEPVTGDSYLIENGAFAHTYAEISF